jgi:hypothetical protein
VPEAPLYDPTPIDPLDAKYTWNCRTELESLTIRTNSESELEELIGRWKYRVLPKREPKRYLKEGDQCQVCDGFLTLQIGTNRKTGREYKFLGCSNFPTCSFSAYVAKEPEPAKAS